MGIIMPIFAWLLLWCAVLVDTTQHSNDELSSQHSARASSHSTHFFKNQFPQSDPASYPESNKLMALTVWRWREAAREMLHHSFGSYMRHAYPADELRPLQCRPRWWHERERGDLDDALLGASLTLIDSLDVLATTGDLPAFRCAVSRLSADATFARDVSVSVFETNIRVVGGLLSAHLLSVDPRLALWGPAACPLGNCSHACDSPGLPHMDFCHDIACLPAYGGQLLAMADEVARRLLPAFNTPTGLPYHRINLASGVVDASSRVTCTAAAGTFLLEFGLLSRLTGDAVFEAVARRAVKALWSRRSTLNLMGSAIDVVDGKWRTAHTGVGAGVDSYLEYLLKAGIALDDGELLGMWEAASSAVGAHVDTPTARLHIEVGMAEGRAAPRPPLVISSLQAWYAGAEVLSGSVTDARAHWRSLASMWSLYSALPEGFDAASNTPIAWGRDAPLRPELAEATYLLYGATRDPALLKHAAAQLIALTNSSRVACGFASVADVATGRLDDRMDSYFLAETGRYLFATFDSALLTWFDGPPGAPSWRRPHVGETMEEEGLLLPSWPFAHGPMEQSVHPVEAAHTWALPSDGTALSYLHHTSRLARLYPAAHPLVYARYDNGTGRESGAGDTLPTLPLEQERVLHSTEGHVMLLGLAPKPVSVRPRGVPPMMNRTHAEFVLRAPWLAGGEHLMCPRLVPHTNSFPPPRPPHFAETVLEEWAEAQAESRTSQGMHTPRGQRAAVCPVSRIKETLSYRQADEQMLHGNEWIMADLSGPVARALPSPPAAVSYHAHALAPWRSSVYPFRGSLDLLPESLADAWVTTVRPALLADITNVAPVVARAMFGVADGGLTSMGGSQASLQATWDTGSGSWHVSDWNGDSQKLLPKERLENALEARKGMHLLMGDVTLRCDSANAHCGAAIGTPGQFVAYRVSVFGPTGSHRFLASSAQFGPLLTGRGTGLLSIVHETPYDGCSPYFNHTTLKGELFVTIRGGCTFAEKARHAQAAGAEALLVLDPATSDQAITFDYNTSNLIEADFVMAGDGGPTVPEIPAAFLPSNLIEAVGKLSGKDKATACIAAAFTEGPKGTCDNMLSRSFKLNDIHVQFAKELFSDETSTQSNIFGSFECECMNEGKNDSK